MVAERLKKISQLEPQPAIIPNVSPVHETVRAAEINLLAVEAATFRCRPPIMAQLLGLTRRHAVKIYKEVTGSPPPSGQLPFDAAFYTRLNCRHIESLLLLKFYQGYSAGGDSFPKALIKAYKLYQEINYDGKDDNSEESEQRISFDRAYYLIRYTQIQKSLHVSTCTRCHCEYLHQAYSIPDETLACPICKTEKPTKNSAKVVRLVE